MVARDDSMDKGIVAPARERGLKFPAIFTASVVSVVAPARERGLKFGFYAGLFRQSSRSREGAWIEIPIGSLMGYLGEGRSREGAWIEIHALLVQ